MANRWCDGFGRYGGNPAYMVNGSSSQAWAEVTTGPSGWSLSNANPRTGDWHLRLTDGSADDPIARRVFGAPMTEVLFGQAMFFAQLPVTEFANGSAAAGFILAQFRGQDNSIQVTVCLGTDGAIAVYRGGGFAVDGTFTGVFLGRSLPRVGAGAYQHFEHYLKIGNGAGAYELRIDEVTAINLTGIDTDTGAGEASQVVVGRGNGGAFGFTAKTVDMADTYCNDTVDDGSGCSWFIGDVKSGCQLVDADTAQSDFALSAGAQGYPLIGQSPPDDATYISRTATTGESDFGLQDGPANLSEVLTVRPFIRAMKDDAGTCLVAPSMKSGAIKGAVTPQPVTTAFAYYDSNVPVNPATGVPWTASGLNAAKVVVERTT